MSVKREDVLKYLEEANMIEISELVKDIEDKFGVTAAVPVAAAAGSCAAAAGPHCSLFRGAARQHPHDRAVCSVSVGRPAVGAA